ncbi:hypothetical protein [Rubrivirga sp. IMCC43871]|uniref:hypothetical protein n=1 Tax=Rubrivirga sp. IMCC43871 TaxID=3391575 RepID=UPI00398FE816
MRALLLLLLIPAATAQSAPDDVWLSVTAGPLLASDSDDFAVASLGLQVARGPWTARVAYAESAGYSIDFSSAFSRAEGASASSPADAVLAHRALALAAGPRWGRGPTTVALTGGPVLSWGDRVEGGSFSGVGAGLAGQAQLQLGGAVWLGAEVSGVAAPVGSFAVVGGTLRVDLVRAPR